MWRLIIVVGLTPMLLGMQAVTTGPRESPSAVVVVSAHETHLTVAGVLQGRLPASGVLEVHEVPAVEYGVDMTALGEPLAVGPLQRRFSFEVPRHASTGLPADLLSGSEGRDRYYSRFLVVARTPEHTGGVPLTPDAQHVTRSHLQVQDERPYPEALTKKGLSIPPAHQQEETGFAHTAPNAVLNALMLPRPLPGDSLEFRSGGRTFWFRKSAVEALDRQIKPMSDNGVLVTLVAYLVNNHDPLWSTNELAHPNADPLDPRALVLAFDLATAQGLEHYVAAMEFLAQRYTRTDERYGRVVGLVVGNEVDIQRIWQNQGKATLDEFMDNYHAAVRVADLAWRKYTAEPRTYISLTKYWNRAHWPDQPLDSYPGKAVIDRMNLLSKRMGDFGWHVAHHPYSSSSAPVWTEELDLSPTADFVTFRNLEVLIDHLDRPELRYDGQPRRINLTEAGFSSGSTNGRELQQAAEYAYAFYRVHFLDRVDAWIYYRAVDGPSGSLDVGLGLWTRDTRRDELPNPLAAPKRSFAVFTDIDTDRSLEATDFAKDVIGIDDWSEVIPGFDPDRLPNRHEPTTVPAAVHLPARPELAVGATGWRPAEEAISVDSGDGDGSLRVNFAQPLGLLWRGADAVLDQAVDATSLPYLQASVRVPQPVAGASHRVMVKAYSGPWRAEGTATLTAPSDWTRVAIDLSTWPHRDAIDRIKVWAIADTHQDWVGGFLLDDVGFVAEPLGTSDREPLPDDVLLHLTFGGTLGPVAPGTTFSGGAERPDAQVRFLGDGGSVTISSQAPPALQGRDHTGSLYFSPSTDGSSGGWLAVDGLDLPRDFVVEAWVKLAPDRAALGNMMVWSYGAIDDTTSTTAVARFQHQLGSSVATYFSEFGTGTTTATAPGLLDGQWRHVAVSYEGLDEGVGRLSTYIDGLLVASALGPERTDVMGTLKMGINDLATPVLYTGWLADVRVSAGASTGTAATP